MAEPDTLPFIRVQLCLMKQDEVTDEFFHNYWRGNHVKLALENKKFVEKVYGITKSVVSPEPLLQTFTYSIFRYSTFSSPWTLHISHFFDISHYAFLRH